ncbi:MAG: phosphocholine cytidylyltransferase family protein [Candidatus Rokubacteria bacterium]|nr:phosphocholine cytidylyltransferase family protein [Candidatus Rokubacteria bacterium]
MRALVLAAGVGKRLAPLTEERPKGLLELGGKSLLARLLDGLAAVGVRETALVVGYRQEQIRAHLGVSHHGMPVRYLENPEYTKGPLLSLWTGRGEFEQDDVVLADGDVLFAPALLERVVRAPAPNVFLAEPDFVDTGEELNLYLRGGQVVALRRGVMGPPAMPFDARAEWVGFVKVGRAAGVELAAALDAFVRQGRTEGDYERALDGLLPRHRFGVCPTEGLPWIEIDFPQDLQAAETEVLPRIRALGLE